MADSGAPLASAAGTAAATESTGAKDTALDQPSDAVKMTPIDTSSKPSSSAAGDAKEEADTDKGKGVTTATEPKPSDAQPGDDTAADPKGKQKAETTTDPDVPPRADSLSINPAPDAHPPATTESSSAPFRTCQITLLLATGARHPYRIDERYLTKREVEIPEQGEDGRPDPFSISVYKLKELILREWRDDWEAKPRDPSLIRLIHFGKLLDDKEQLKKYRFNEQHSNIVHMTIRPAEMVEEDEAGKSGGGARVHRDYPRSGCCCVIL